MEIVAQTKQIRISPRKLRLIADSIRSFTPYEALDALSQIEKRASVSLLKTLKSALANAKNNTKVDANNLVIKSIDILEGPALKRYHPSSRGRVHPYKKRSSHIKIVLGERRKISV